MEVHLRQNSVPKWVAHGCASFSVVTPGKTGVAETCLRICDSFQQVVRPLKTDTARRGNLAGLEASLNFEFWEEVDLR